VAAIITGVVSTDQIQWARGNGPGILTGWAKTWELQSLTASAYNENIGDSETSQVQSAEGSGLVIEAGHINGAVSTGQVQWARANGPGILTGWGKTWQAQKLEVEAYTELLASVDTSQVQGSSGTGYLGEQIRGTGITGQMEQVNGTGTVTQPERPPSPREERMGGSGTYYGPFGAPFLIPVNQDLGYALGGKGLVDVAVRFGKGDTWKRANAVNRSETSYQVTVESLHEKAVDSTLGFIKSLPKPPVVDTSMSFLKTLGTPVPKIINEEPEVIPAPVEEPIMESATHTKPIVSEAMFVGVSEFKEVITESVVKTGRPAPSIKVTATLVPIV